LVAIEDHAMNQASRKENQPRRNTLVEFLTGGLAGSLLAFVLALVTATILIEFAGFDAPEGYRAMLSGAFGSPIALADVLARSTPLIFTGLSVAVGLRAGLFNVGSEGQLLLGAMAALLVGLIQGVPMRMHWLHVLFAYAAAAIVGGLWGIVPAILKARFRAHEVITTIMLNYVAILITGYLANYPLHPPGEMLPATARVVESAKLPRLVQGSQLTIALFVGIGCAILLGLLFKQSVLGYEIRAVGLNRLAAEAKGISQTRVWLVAMAIGGAMAGMGGAGEVLGVHRRFVEGFSPGYGFDGIAVALIGNKNPVTIVLAALLLGAIRTGALVMDRTTSIPADFVMVIQGVLLIFLAVPAILQIILERRRAVIVQDQY